MQLGCCGAYHYSDYKNITWQKVVSTAIVPVSCCALVDGPGHIPTSKSQFKDFDGCQKANPTASSINQEVTPHLQINYSLPKRVFIEVMKLVNGLVLFYNAMNCCKRISTEEMKVHVVTILITRRTDKTVGYVMRPFLQLTSARCCSQFAVWFFLPTRYAAPCPALCCLKPLREATNDSFPTPTVTSVRVNARISSSPGR